MPKTVKFSISMPAPEFKALESARRKAGRTRSQFIREAVLRVPAEPAEGTEAPGIKEDRSPYGSFPSGLTDIAELKQRAIDAAGKVDSGVPDLSVGHDRYLTDDEVTDSTTRPGAHGKTEGTR